MEENGEYGDDSSTTYSTYDETPRFTDDKEEEVSENIRVVCRFR
jgi:hypothetical protein